MKPHIVFEAFQTGIGLQCSMYVFKNLHLGGVGSGRPARVIEIRVRVNIVNTYPNVAQETS